MSDESPVTWDAAIRAYIGAIGFIVVLIGAEMMAEKESARFWTGLLLVLAGFPIFSSVVFWTTLRSRLKAQTVSQLRSIAVTPFKWVATALVLWIFFAIEILALELVSLATWVWSAIGMIFLLFILRRLGPRQA